MATLLSLQREQKLLAMKEVVLCPVETFGFNNPDSGGRSLMSCVKIAMTDFTREFMFHMSRILLGVVRSV